MDRKKISNLLCMLVPWGVLCLAVLIDIWFLLKYGAKFMDSDMASNMLRASVNNTDKTLLSGNVFYSTGLCILGETNVYQLALLIIKNDWVMARLLGMVIMILLAIASYLLLCKVNGMEMKLSVLFAACITCPIGYWYLSLVTFGGFYYMLMVHSMLWICLLLSLTFGESKSYRLWIMLVLLAVYSFVMGMDGIKDLMFPVIPVFFAALILAFLYVRKTRSFKDIMKRFEGRFVLISTLATMFCVMGYLFNMVFLSKRYVFETHNDRLWGAFSISNIFKGLSEFLSLFGYQHDEWIYLLSREKAVTSVFSWQGIASCFGMLIAGFLVFSFVRLCMRYNRLSDKNKVILWIFIIGLFVSVIFLKWTEGSDSGPQYMIPLMPFAFMIMQMEIKTEDFVFSFTGTLLAYFLAACVFITSAATISQYIKNPYHLESDKLITNVAKWLQDNGYKQGYATFWQANIVTALTDGEIEMWDVWGFDNLELHKWLQRTDHINPPSGERVFALIGPNDELDRDVFLQYMNTAPGIPEIVYQDEEGYIVVEYK